MVVLKLQKILYTTRVETRVFQHSSYCPNSPKLCQLHYVIL